MNDDANNGKHGGDGHCSQATALFFSVLVLIACFAGAMTVAAWLFLQGLDLAGIAWLIAAGYCVLVLAGLAGAALVLRIMGCCLPDLRRAGCDEQPSLPNGDSPGKA